MKLYIIRSRDTDWYWGGVRWVADLKNATLMTADEVKEVIKMLPEPEDKFCVYRVERN